MRVDANTELSVAQAVTATAISANVIALKGAGLSPNATRNLGAPAVVYLNIVCTETATAAGAATVTFTLESAADAGLTSGPVVHVATAAVPLAGLTANKVIARIPLPNDGYKAFVGARYTVGTGPLTAGRFTAFIGPEMHSWQPYENASSD